jgi:hypothetical protein
MFFIPFLLVLRWHCVKHASLWFWGFCFSQNASNVVIVDSYAMSSVPAATMRHNFHAGGFEHDESSLAWLDDAGKC